LTFGLILTATIVAAVAYIAWWVIVRIYPVTTRVKTKGFNTKSQGPEL
jgi:hypothetical protein